MLTASRRCLRTPEELLLAVADGDTDAFSSLYNHLIRPVSRLVRSILRDAAQSDEVVQEVFLELWRLATRYRSDKGTALCWALTVAHCRAVDRVRANQARLDREREVVARTHFRPYDEVSETALDNWERSRIREALLNLTPLQREAVTLAYYGSHTYREVAQLLDLPPGTAKTRIRSGLLQLRDELR